MTRPNRFATWLLALVFPTSLPGCLDEVEDPDKPLAISGTVTYKGAPVKRGTIQFLPAVAGGLPATGTVVDGVIRDVTTRTRGDGVKAGKYRIAVSAYDEEFLKIAAKGTYNGPDPDDVARTAKYRNSPIPPRYASIRDSGLVAEFSPTRKEIRIDLVE